MGGAEHARNIKTRKTDRHALGYHGNGGKTDHTRSGDTGRGGQTTLVRVMRGGGDLGKQIF